MWLSTTRMKIFGTSRVIGPRAYSIGKTQPSHSKPSTKGTLYPSARSCHDVSIWLNLTFLYYLSTESEGLLFLYGNVGRSHGLFQVAWGNGDTIDLTTFPPRTTFNGESDSELSNVLLFAGVAPEGGWDNLYFTHTDDRDARKLEFTRLEVYTTNQEHESAR